MMGGVHGVLKILGVVGGGTVMIEGWNPTERAVVVRTSIVSSGASALAIENGVGLIIPAVGIVAIPAC